MTYLWYYLAIGACFMLWSVVSGLYANTLQRRDVTYLRKDGKPPVRKENHRSWSLFIGTALFDLLLWPLMVLFKVFVGLNIATSWVLERIMG